MALATMASERLERKISGEVEQVEEVKEEVGVGEEEQRQRSQAYALHARTHTHTRDSLDMGRCGSVRWGKDGVYSRVRRAGGKDGSEWVGMGQNATLR